MLHSGIIQKSLSPFSSLAMLVRKKDAIWQFLCGLSHVERRHEQGPLPNPYRG